MNNTTSNDAAQMIANKIDSSSSEEIEAMIRITSEIYGSSVRAAVGNFYAKITPSVMKSGIQVG